MNNMEIKPPWYVALVAAPPERTKAPAALEAALFSAIERALYDPRHPLHQQTFGFYGAPGAGFEIAAMDAEQKLLKAQSTYCQDRRARSASRPDQNLSRSTAAAPRCGDRSTSDRPRRAPTCWTVSTSSPTTLRSRSLTLSMQGSGSALRIADADGAPDAWASDR